MEKWKITSALSTTPLHHTNDTVEQVRLGNTFLMENIQIIFSMKFPRGLTTSFQQNRTRYSEKQLEIFRLVQSLHKDGLGYRRIAKVLNEKGLNTEEGHLWKNRNVYSVLKRYSERQDRLKFRRKNFLLFVGECGWNLLSKY